MSAPVQYDDGMVENSRPPVYHVSSGSDDRVALPNQYLPSSLDSHECIDGGDFARIFRWKPGIAIKVSRYAWWIPGDERAEVVGRNWKMVFDRELHILEILGDHPRILKYLGLCEEHYGRLFPEAIHGNLQQYVWIHHEDISLSLQLKWRSQAAEALSYIHQKRVVHSDIRPGNFLLQGDSEDNLDIVLCGFGGAAYEDKQAISYPRNSYRDPLRTWPLEVNLQGVHADIYALGSTFYYIMAGNDPHLPRNCNDLPFQDRVELEQKVKWLLVDKKFPDVDDIVGGEILLGCWTYQYPSAEELIRAQEISFKDLQEI